MFFLILFGLGVSLVAGFESTGSVVFLALMSRVGAGFAGGLDDSRALTMASCRVEDECVKAGVRSGGVSGEGASLVGASSCVRGSTSVVMGCGVSVGSVSVEVSSC